MTDDALANRVTELERQVRVLIDDRVQLGQRLVETTESQRKVDLTFHAAINRNARVVALIAERVAGEYPEVVAAARELRDATESG